MNENGSGRGAKKSEILGGPAEGGHLDHTQHTPHTQQHTHTTHTHTSGLTRLYLTWSGPKLVGPNSVIVSGPHFSGIWDPTLFFVCSFLKKKAKRLKHQFGPKSDLAKVSIKGSSRLPCSSRRFFFQAAVCRLLAVFRLVRYTFIQIGMKLSLFIPKFFIQNHFHPPQTPTPTPHT